MYVSHGMRSPARFRCLISYQMRRYWAVCVCLVVGVSETKRRVREARRTRRARGNISPTDARGLDGVGAFLARSVGVCGGPMGSVDRVRGNQTRGETGESMEKSSTFVALSVTCPAPSLFCDRFSYKASTLVSALLQLLPARSCIRHQATLASSSWPSVP